MEINRVFLIVLDSFGVGAAPDAAEFGDAGADTLGSCAAAGTLSLPNLRRLGLFNIPGVSCGEAEPLPRGAFGRLREYSRGKDTTVGHWELAGLVSPRPLPVYPEGFPPEIIGEFQRRTGRGVLCNRPASGTQVIRDYGREQAETGKLIVYTSADSVFQIAAHESYIGLDELYRCCEIARELLQGTHGVGRVIARPFVGEWPDYVRTANRHDYSLQPPGLTLPRALADAGFDVIGVGKIGDVFAGDGIRETFPTRSNADGMARTLALADRDFRGLCFVNLVDFDTMYGHRRDAAGYAAALNEFDRWLGGFLPRLRAGDLLLMTGDHGCDPGYGGTDHTREYVPLLAAGPAVSPGAALGTRAFSDAGATVLSLFGVRAEIAGESLADGIFGCPNESDRALFARALETRERSYAPYSRFAVGAALLCRDGTVYTGCNMENAAFTPTVCAERTALFRAVSEGRRDFAAVAVAGGPADSPPDSLCAPCGVCRQALAEFCGGELRVVLGPSAEDLRICTLSQLLPLAFGPDSLN